jgi:hypothetical protein
MVRLFRRIPWKLALIISPHFRFWECPNGGTFSPSWWVLTVSERSPQTGVECKYRHALPPGFVLKSQRKKEDEDKAKEAISLEDFLEVEVRELFEVFHSSVNL